VSPSAGHFLRAIEHSETCIVSAVTLLETRMVLSGRFVASALTDVVTLLDEVAPDIIPFSAEQAAMEFSASERYGKSMGTSAKHNMGDCASYALARSRNVPLLFKGEDFEWTDIVAAV
jgi:ribonuclease VapC